MAARPRIEAFACESDARRPFTVRGQTARALCALVAAGPRGVTALDVSGTWAYRFAAYCHKLRTRHGLAIRTDREPHPGGWHGRHVLETPVVIVAMDEPENRLKQDDEGRWLGDPRGGSTHGPA